MLSYGGLALLEAGSTVCISFSHDGDYIATASRDSVSIWRTNENKELHRFDGISRALSLVWDRNGTLYCGFQDGLCVALVMDDGKSELRSHGFRASDKPIKCIDIDGDSLQLVVAGDNVVGIYNRADTGEFTPWKFSQSLPDPSRMGLSDPLVVSTVFWLAGDRKKLAVSYLPNRVVVWDLVLQQSHLTLHVPGGVVSTGDLSPNGKCFAVPTLEEGFDVWVIGSAVHLGFFGNRAPASVSHRPVKFIHGGTMLLCAAHEEAIIWQIDSGIRVQRLASNNGHPVHLVSANYNATCDRFRIAIAAGKTIQILEAYEIFPAADEGRPQGSGFWTLSWLESRRAAAVLAVICLINAISLAGMWYRKEDVRIQS